MKNKLKIAQIQEYAKTLSLANLSEDSFILADKSKEQLDCLIEVLENEINERKAKGVEKRFKASHIPKYKKLEDFDTDFNKRVTKDMIEKLGDLDWLFGRYNIIFVGGAGTGKSHLAQALGLKVIESGNKVSYTSFFELIAMLKSKDDIRQHKAKLKYIAECKLLIIDELGYLSVTREEANLFYQYLTTINGKMSIIITTNLEFGYWGELLGDELLATAIVDRLTHRCQIISTFGKSYRLAHHENIYSLKKQK